MRNDRDRFFRRRRDPARRIFGDRTHDTSIAPVDREQTRLALQARIRYGRGFGASARLNYGDGFAYALAKSLDAPLLYMGDGFVGTDVISAFATD